MRAATPGAEPEVVAHHPVMLDVDEWRDCKVIDAVWSGTRYQSRRVDEGGLRDKLCELAHQRRRSGYRRPPIQLRCDGILNDRKRPSGATGSKVSPCGGTPAPELTGIIDTERASCTRAISCLIV
jgi:hypothetical protein